MLKISILGINELTVAVKAKGEEEEQISFNISLCK